MTTKRIWVEGMDGTGKTTFCNALATALGNACVYAFPSRRSAVGGLIRDVFEGKQKVDPMAMLWLFIAEGVDLEQEILNEAHKSHVIVDRHPAISSVVYQLAKHCAGDILSVKRAAHFTPPDVLFLLDVAPQTALARRRSRSEEPNKLFESDDIVRLESMRIQYLRAVRDYSPRVRILNAEKPTDELVKLALVAI